MRLCLRRFPSTLTLSAEQVAISCSLGLGLTHCPSGAAHQDAFTTLQQTQAGLRSQAQAVQAAGRNAAISQLSLNQQGQVLNAMNTLGQRNQAVGQEAQFRARAAANSPSQAEFQASQSQGYRQAQTQERERFMQRSNTRPQ